MSCGVYVFRRLSLAYSMSMMGPSYVVSLFVQQLRADGCLVYRLVVDWTDQRESGGCRVGESTSTINHPSFAPLDSFITITSIAKAINSRLGSVQDGSR